MDNEHLTRFIERYLDSKMQPSERKWFEKELEGNRWLQEELELRQKANEYATNGDAIQFRKKLIEAELRHRSKTPIQKAVTSRSIYYAATLLGVIIITGSLIISTLITDPQQLMEDYTEIQPISYSRAAEVTSDSDILKAIESYNDQNFEEAGEIFKTALSKKTLSENESIEAEYRMAISFMKSGMNHEAIESFKNIIDHNDNLHIEDASFYIGVCYLKVDENEKARTVLEGIAASDSRYRKQAKKLARKIK